MFKPKLIYVYDAWCGWCYGFTPVISAIAREFSGRLDHEVLSGGMILGSRGGPIGVVAPYIKTEYRAVEEATGVVFGEAFLRNVERGEMILDSERPAIALAVFRSYDPHKVIQFAHEIQDAINYEGKDPNHDEMYRYIAVNHGYDPDEAVHKLKEEEYRQAAYYDFALVRQLQITSFPAAIVQTGELNFYRAAKGYTDYDTLQLRISNILHETGNLK